MAFLDRKNYPWLIISLAAADFSKLPSMNTSLAHLG